MVSPTLAPTTLAPTTRRPLALQRRDAPRRLHVDRTDINFFNVSANRVRIEITVHNHGIRRSRPRPMAIEAAPLGAFLRWEPVTRLMVPSIEPGESVVVATEADESELPTSPGFGRPPGDAVRIAGGQEDDLRAMEAAKAYLRRVLPMVDFDNLDLAATRFLAMYRGDDRHWAGNINVRFEGRAVERHMAQALRMEPQRPNVMCFFVGFEPDRYAFHLGGDAACWEIELSLADVIPFGEWVHCPKPVPFSLTVTPPDWARTGSVDVRVTQESTGKVAIVEFTLDAHGAGPGCYTV